jgi:hypothetical protein
MFKVMPRFTTSAVISAAEAAENGSNRDSSAAAPAAEWKVSTQACVQVSECGTHLGQWPCVPLVLLPAWTTNWEYQPGIQFLSERHCGPG